MLSRWGHTLAACVVLLSAAQPSFAQLYQSPKYEFRGAWIATVLGLDWPDRSAHPSAQKASLTAMLNGLKAAGVNAVFFQVRSEADAMYASDLEPWSYWLTGAQGAPPDPYYDPLAFAVEEAHRRGMELHAWFNPYRAIRGSGYPQALDHVSLLRPDWMLSFRSHLQMDPGLGEVRDYITRVVMDVTRRYDVDGIHFDDYFYPYPPNHISTEDSDTFASHSRGITSLGAWRRDNVNLLIAQLSDSLRSERPEIKYGISPFGIWKNNVPAGIRGLDAYNVIFADPTAWLAAETIDYLVPQLYWPFGGGQDYGALGRWWIEQINGRHLYIGHALYKADLHTYGGALYSPTEIPEQVRFNRDWLDILGSVFFRARNITEYSSQDFVYTMQTGQYQYPALTPPMSWKDQTPPEAPEFLSFAWTTGPELTLTWEAPNPAPERYTVYRILSDLQPDFGPATRDARNLLAVTGDTSVTDRPGIATDTYYYAVRAVSANSIESMESNVVSLKGRATAAQSTQPLALRQLANYPNPFRSSTRIVFVLDRATTVTLRVYNILGQEVATFLEERWSSAGAYTFHWDGASESGQPLGSGTYLYVLEADGQRITRRMTLIR